MKEKGLTFRWLAEILRGADVEDIMPVVCLKQGTNKAIRAK